MDFAEAFKTGFAEETRHKIWKYIATPLTDGDREKFKTEMPKKGLRMPNAEYGENNLRFDINYLNAIGGVVCMLPLEFMAEYVDNICKTSMDRQDGIMEQDVLSGDITDESLAKDINATSLGNMAYIALKTKDDQVKNKCLDTLWRYLNLYLDNLVKSYMEITKNQDVN